MARNKKRVRRRITLMEDALPSHVSIVDHGANQKPVKVIKIDQKTKLDYENRGQLEKSSKKNIRTYKSVDTPTSGMDIVELFLSKELFSSEDEAIYWLEDGGYEGYEIKETDNGFQVIFSHEGEKYCFGEGGITVCVNKTIKGSSMIKKYRSAVKALFETKASKRKTLNKVSKFNKRYTPSQKEEGSSVLEDNLKAEMPVAETAPKGSSEFAREALMQALELLEGGNIEEVKVLLNDLLVVSEELEQMPMAEVAAVEEPVVEEEDKDKETEVPAEEEAKKELAEDGTENKALPTEPNTNAPQDAESEEKPTVVIQPGSETAQKEIGEEGTENAAVPKEPNTNAPQEAEQADRGVEVITPTEADKNLAATVAKLATSIEALQSFVVEKMLDTDEKVSKQEGDSDCDMYARNSVLKSAGGDSSGFPASKLTQAELNNNFKNFKL